MTHLSAPTYASSAPKAAQHAPGVMAIARQPILNAKHAVFGYELFDRSKNNQPYSAASDAALLFNLLSNADSEVINRRNVIFINCTLQTLAGGHLTLIEPEHVVLEVPTLPDDQASAENIDTYHQTLAAVHKRGFRLSFGSPVLAPAYAAWQSLASFIKFAMTSALSATQADSAIFGVMPSTS